MGPKSEVVTRRFLAETAKESAASDEALAAFSHALQITRATFQAAHRGDDRAAAHQGLQAIQSLAEALRHIAPEHALGLNAITAKASSLLPAVQMEAVKDNVLHQASLRASEGKR